MTLSQDYVYQQKSISSQDQNYFVHFAMRYPVIQAVQGIPLQGALQPVRSQQQQNINNPVRESATSAQRCVLPVSFPVG